MKQTTFTKLYLLGTTTALVAAALMALTALVQANILSIPASLLDPSVSDQPIKSDILDRLNLERRNRGIPALKFDERLSVSACKKLDDFVSENNYQHDYRDGRVWYSDFDPFWTARGEILAWKYQGAQLISAWLNSPKHRDVVLKATFTHFGVCQKGNYSAVHFGFMISD